MLEGGRLCQRMWIKEGFTSQNRTEIYWYQVRDGIMIDLQRSCFFFFPSLVSPYAVDMKLLHWQISTFFSLICWTIGWISLCCNFTCSLPWGAELRLDLRSDWHNTSDSVGLDFEHILESVKGSNALTWHQNRDGSRRTLYPSLEDLPSPSRNAFRSHPKKSETCWE